MIKAGLVHKIISAVMSFCFLTGSFDFDIHRCEDTHHTYVVPLITGISCEKIHPESACNHQEGGNCKDDEACCQDIVERLEITGSNVSDLCVSAPSPAIVPVPASVFPEFSDVSLPVFDTVSQSDCLPPPDNSILCVLRV